MVVCAMKILVLFAMMFCHIVNDYNLQGWLANAKQKQWWKENVPQEIYKNDYLMALFEHAFSWAFMVEIPVWVYMIAINKGVLLTTLFVCVFNTVLHAYIDDLKANKMAINLVQDQIYHFAQILVTWLICVVFLCK